MTVNRFGLPPAIARSAAFGSAVNVTGALKLVTWAPVLASVTFKSNTVPFGLPTTVGGRAGKVTAGGNVVVKGVVAVASGAEVGGDVRPTLPAMRFAPVATLTVAVRVAGAFAVSWEARM